MTSSSSDEFESCGDFLKNKKSTKGIPMDHDEFVKQLTQEHDNLLKKMQENSEKLAAMAETSKLLLEESAACAKKAKELKAEKKALQRRVLEQSHLTELAKKADTEKKEETPGGLVRGKSEEETRKLFDEFCKMLKAKNNIDDARQTALKAKKAKKRKNLLQKHKVQRAELKDLKQQLQEEKEAAAKPKPVPEQLKPKPEKPKPKPKATEAIPKPTEKKVKSKIDDKKVAEKAKESEQAPPDPQKEKIRIIYPKMKWTSLKTHKVQISFCETPEFVFPKFCSICKNVGGHTSERCGERIYIQDLWIHLNKNNTCTRCEEMGHTIGRCPYEDRVWCRSCKRNRLQNDHSERLCPVEWEKQLVEYEEHIEEEKKNKETSQETKNGMGHNDQPGPSNRYDNDDELMDYE